MRCPNGYEVQELDFENISNVVLSEYFLDPVHVQILRKVNIQITKIETSMRQMFTLSDNAQLEKLGLDAKFDMAALPNDAAAQ